MPFLLLGSISGCVLNRFENRLGGEANAREPASIVQGRHFEPETIVLCIRWYLHFALSYRNLDETMAERNLSINHLYEVAVVQRYAPEFGHRRVENGHGGSTASNRSGRRKRSVAGTGGHGQYLPEIEGRSLDKSIGQVLCARSLKKYLCPLICAQREGTLSGTRILPLLTKADITRNSDRQSKRQCMQCAKSRCRSRSLCQLNCLGRSDRMRPRSWQRGWRDWTGSGFLSYHQVCRSDGSAFLLPVNAKSLIRQTAGSCAHHRSRAR
jgi:hypothetical protein